MQSVSKKTTHRSSLGNRLFLWFFPPPKHQKIHIFWRYDIMVSPRGNNGNVPRERKRKAQKNQSLFNPLYNKSVPRERKRKRGTNRFFNPLKSRVIIKMSAGHRLEKVAYCPIDKDLKKSSLCLCSLKIE